MKGPTHMELTVKSLEGAKIIARALGRLNPDAARRYMDGYDLRNHIERQARAALYVVA